MSEINVREVKDGKEAKKHIKRGLLVFIVFALAVGYLILSR